MNDNRQPIGCEYQYVLPMPPFLYLPTIRDDDDLCILIFHTIVLCGYCCDSILCHFNSTATIISLLGENKYVLKRYSTDAQQRQ